jgi:hypothetical protein
MMRVKMGVMQREQESQRAKEREQNLHHEIITSEVAIYTTLSYYPFHASDYWESRRSLIFWLNCLMDLKITFVIGGNSWNYCKIFTV